MSYATAEELAAELRLTVTPANQAKLQACVDAAAAEINHALDVKPLEVIPGADWLYDSTQAAADPGPGTFRMDRSNPPAVSELYFNTLDADGVSHADTFALLGIGDLLRLFDEASPTRYEQYTLDGDVVDNVGWLTLPAMWTASGGTYVATHATDGARVHVVALQVTPRLTQGLALVNRVNLVRGVEWFKSNDAAFGVIGFQETGILQAPRDAFIRHARALIPVKQRFGIA